MTSTGGIKNNIVDGSNIVPFRRPELKDMPNVQTGGPRKARRTKVSPYDADDAETAGRTVVASFQNFAHSPEQTELMGFVIDGMTSEQRDPDQTYSMNQLISFLRGDIGDGTEPKVSEPAAFRSGDFGDQELPDGQPFRAITTMPDNDAPTVFLSRELGFKESLLAARDAYSDVAVGLARQLGIEVAPGDVGQQISETVATGLPPDMGYDKDAPVEVTITIDGMSVVGLPR